MLPRTYLLARNYMTANKTVAAGVMGGSELIGA